MTRYRLDDLGWLQFEQLCQSLLKAELGLAIESWGRHSDRGRDAFCALSLPIVKGRCEPGPFVFQAKFVSEANAAGAKPASALLKAVVAECRLIEARKPPAQSSTPRQYVLLTNVPLSASLREAVQEEINRVIPSCVVTSWGADDICDVLDVNPSLKLAFPELLGLRDLEQLLSAAINRAVLERSRAALEEARGLADVFVPTRQYFQALSTLEKHNFVVLTGPPEMGKTTIARMIGLAKLAQGWQCFECMTPKDLFDNLDDSVGQVFVADDAFGTTEYMPELAVPWGQQLSFVIRRLRETRWLVWTSRPAPLHFALEHLHLQGAASGFPSLAEIEVNASALLLDEKVKILYRHAKAARLDHAAKSVIKKYAPQIVRHGYFTPERIRRFVTDRLPSLPSTLERSRDRKAAIAEAVTAEIDRPTEQMRKSFERIDTPHQNFLLAMLDAAPSKPLATDVHDAYFRLFESETDLPPEKIALDLDGHFIRCRNLLGVRVSPSAQREDRYEWVHPSWRDIAIDHLTTHLLKKRAFLARCSSHGISLALSVGGGVSGERSSPLIKDAEDWNALDERVTQVLDKSGSKETDAVLGTLAQVFAVAKGERNKVPFPELNRLTHRALHALRAHWNRDRVSMSAANLAAYYELSLLVQPLVPSPDLSDAWIQHCDSFTEELKEGWVVALKKELVCEWIGFADTLRFYEPRFMMQVDFPACCQSWVERVFEIIRTYDHYDLCERKKEDLETEVEFIGELSRLVARLNEVCDPPKGEVNKTTKRLEEQLESLREEIDMAPSKERGGLTTSMPSPGTGCSTSIETDADIEAAFEDL
jgi:hypothetical protein